MCWMMSRHRNFFDSHRAYCEYWESNGYRDFHGGTEGIDWVGLGEGGGTVFEEVVGMTALLDLGNILYVLVTGNILWVLVLLDLAVSALS